jgi:hypothetical protein
MDKHGFAYNNINTNINNNAITTNIVVITIDNTFRLSRCLSKYELFNICPLGGLELLVKVYQSKLNYRKSPLLVPGLGQHFQMQITFYSTHLLI